MKSQISTGVDRSKTTPITTLFITAILIILVGVGLTVFSVINNISFAVFNSQVHGSAWGVVMMFLGVRYLLAVQRLKTQVYQSTARFSWDNFKKDKTRKL
jgi:hypothetical protein